jgi:hypothetical protein
MYTTLCSKRRCIFLDLHINDEALSSTTCEIEPELGLFFIKQKLQAFVAVATDWMSCDAMTHANGKAAYKQFVTAMNESL